MIAERTTLAQFLAEDRRRHAAPGGDLHSLVLDVALACMAVADRAARGSLGSTDVHNCFLRAAGRSGHLAGTVSAALDEPHVPPARRPRGDHLLAFDPLDGASDIDLNAPVGSIFSILRMPRTGADAAAQDFLQPGTAQVCAGYALHGPATVLVLTLGRGVHAFTLDPVLGEFVRTREAIRIRPHAREVAISASNGRFREPAARRFASLAAETHRILTRGGVFSSPREATDLLHGANPVALLVEQAGGAATTGRGRVLDVVPTDLHQRVPLIAGTAAEVALIDRYHRRHDDRPYDSPLYGDRGLFRVGTG